MAVQVIASAYTDGPTLTAAAAASCVPTYVPTTLPAGYWQIGRMWRLTAAGRISSVVTTPGTARFDLRLGGVIAWDSLAIALNAAAVVTQGWWLDVLLTCVSVGSGTLATLKGQGNFRSLDIVGEHGHGSNMSLPVGTPGAAGTGFNSQSALTLDFFFTQTVATGSLIVHQFLIEQLTP